MNIKISFIVPVRGGSERVPNKNTKPFHNTTLLDIKLSSLIQLCDKKIPDVPIIISKQDIVVNTDCKTAMEIARKYNVRIHERESYYASSQCSNGDFFKHIAENESEPLDMRTICVYVPVTAPLLTSVSIEKALQEYFIHVFKKQMGDDTYSHNYNCLVSYNTFQQPMWYNGRPINYEIGTSLKSQNLPKYKVINYGVCICTRNDQIRYKNVVLDKPYFFELSRQESMDIDTIDDFEQAEIAYINKL